MDSNFLNLKATQQRSSRQCPDCAEPLFLFKAGSAIVDKCNECHGLWLDNNEFSIFKNTLDSYNLKNIGKVFTLPETDDYKISTCPDCETALSPVRYSYKSGIEFLKCNPCKGLWLTLNIKLKLIALTKVGQEIAGDLNSLIAEIKKLENDQKFYQKLKTIGYGLKKRVRRFFFPFSLF